MAAGSELSTPMVGREAEIGALRAAWRQALSGSGQLVLLSGDGGIGKSRLAEEFARELGAADAQVIWGRCYEGEGAPDYWPWRQVLQQAIDSGATPSLDPAAWPLSLILEGSPSAGAGDELTRHGDRFRLAQAVDSCLAEVARTGPVLLVLDDLHWADEASLGLAEFVCIQGCLRQNPILIIGTYRTAEPEANPALGEAVVRLKRGPLAGAFQLPGLSLNETAELVEQIQGQAADQAAVERLHAYAEGNPFVVGEAVRMARGPLTEQSIEAAPWRAGPLSPIAVRLGALPANVREVLEAAAVLGREFTSNLLAAVAGTDPASLLEQLDFAEQARIVQPVSSTPGRYRFVHALLRESFYGDILAGRKQKLHFRAAEALERLSRYDVDGNLAELVRHFTMGAALGGADRAVSYSLRLGEQANARYAYQSAAATFAQALALRKTWPGRAAETAELHLGHGEALRRLGRPDDAREAYRQAASIGRTLIREGDPQGPVILGRAALGFARAKFGFTEPEAIDLLEEATTHLAGAETPLRALLMAALGTALGFGERLEEGRAFARGALAMARLLGDRWTLGFVLDAAHSVLTSPRDTVFRLELARELVAIGEPEFAILGRRWAVCDLLELGDWDATQKEIAIHAALAEKLQQPIHLWYAALFEAMKTAASGDLAEAEAAASRAMVAGQQSGSPDTAQFYVALLLNVRREQGRSAEMEPMLAAMETSTIQAPAWRAVLASIRAETGRYAEARVLFDQLVANDFAAIADDNYRLLQFYLLAEVCVELKDADVAAKLAKELLPYRPRMVEAGNGVLAVAPVAHSLGRLALVVGDTGSAASHFRDAIAMAASWHAPGMRAHALYGLALALQETEPEQASHVFEEAAEIATRLGYQRLRSEMERRPIRRPATVALAGLSARELEVLVLVAAGLSNQRIAEDLFLSLNTVIRHVSNIYNKIGAGNRSEATAWAMANNVVRH